MIVCTERKKPTFFQKTGYLNLNIARMLAFCYENMILGNTFPENCYLFQQIKGKKPTRGVKMVQTKAFFEKMLADLQAQLQKANKELEASPPGNVVRVKRANKYTFFQVYNQENERVRKSITKDAAMINALARKAYLNTEIKILEKDIKATTVFIHNFEEPIYENIIAALPERFQQYDLAKRDQSAWSSQPYRQSTYMPQHKRHTTSRGLKVRSKSELLIAEKLSEHGIPFRYEQILEIGGAEYAPDFTILRPDGQLIYWEHCGLTSDTRYMSHHWQKMQAYSEAGILPWKNLIVTYDDEDGILDMAAVESEIKNKVMK